MLDPQMNLQGMLNLLFGALGDSLTFILGPFVALILNPLAQILGLFS